MQHNGAVSLSWILSLPGLRRVMHGDIMTKMMRAGDMVLKDSEGGDAGIVIRYFFDVNHNDPHTS
jgi:hypothetical protein